MRDNYKIHTHGSLPSHLSCVSRVSSLILCAVQMNSGNNTWFLLDSGAGSAALNMALDEALLEAMPRLHQPVLRFYSWTEHAASFGYFQPYAQLARLTPLRPLVRRPTGGGLVPHDADWTYSLCFPVDHAWWHLRAVQSYRRVHDWIQASLARLGSATTLAPSRHLATPGQCFSGYEVSDVLWQGHKIAGAAQRRTRLGLLIQGSVQPGELGVTRAAWQKAMLESASEKQDVAWRNFELDSYLREGADTLAAQKYSRDAYNQRR